MSKNKKSKYIFQKISRFLLKAIFEIFLLIFDALLLGIGFFVLVSLIWELENNLEIIGYEAYIIGIACCLIVVRTFLIRGLPSMRIRWLVHSFPEFCRIIREDKAQRLTELTEDTKKEEINE